MWFFRVLRFFIYFAKITIHFYHFNLFRFHGKYFNIIVSFFLYSLGKNIFSYSSQLLLFGMKSINPVQKYRHITWMVCLCSINICYKIFISNEFSNFFWNMFISTMIKVCYIFSIPNNSIQWVSIDPYSSRLFTYATSFIFGKLFSR